MPSAFIALLDDVRQQAHDQIYDIALSVQAGITGPQGQAFGDVNISPDDRIARFVDFAQRGVLDALRGLTPSGPPVYWTLLREYVADMNHSALMQPAPVSPRVLTDLMSVMGGR